MEFYQNNDNDRAQLYCIGVVYCPSENKNTPISIRLNGDAGDECLAFDGQIYGDLQVSMRPGCFFTCGNNMFPNLVHLPCQHGSMDTFFLV